MQPSALTLPACGDAPSATTARPTDLPVVALKDLVQRPQDYQGKTVAVSGRFAGMCADGADFYFKDELDMIEVLLPPAGLPRDLQIGTALEVRGTVLVRGTAAGPEAGSTETESTAPESSESDVKIRAEHVERTGT